MRSQNELTDDIKYLLALLPPWAKDVPPGLDPTMYGTGSYAGDIKVKAEIDKIVNKLTNHDWQ